MDILNEIVGTAWPLFKIFWPVCVPALFVFLFKMSPDLALGPV